MANSQSYNSYDNNGWDDYNNNGNELEYDYLYHSSFHSNGLIYSREFRDILKDINEEIENATKKKK